MMQNRLRLSAALALAGVSVLLAGCAPALVGKWKGNIAGDNPMHLKAETTVEFKQDGTFTQTTNVAMFGVASTSGTYKVDGDNVEMTVKDLQIGGKSAMGTNPGQSNQPKVVKSAWKVHDDKLDLTISGKTATLDKVKE